MQIILDVNDAFDTETKLFMERLAKSLKDDDEYSFLSDSIFAQIETNEFHYFASSFLNWTADSDLFKCLKLQHKADKSSGLNVKHCYVYRVPGPKTSAYRIKNYVPDVPGVTTITKVDY